MDPRLLVLVLLALALFCIYKNKKNNTQKGGEDDVLEVANKGTMEPMEPMEPMEQKEPMEPIKKKEVDNTDTISNMRLRIEELKSDLNKTRDINKNLMNTNNNLKKENYNLKEEIRFKMLDKNNDMQINMEEFLNRNENYTKL